MPTLTPADIKKIQDLYRELEYLHDQRANIKKAASEPMEVFVSILGRQGTSGVSHYDFRDFDAVAQSEICAAIGRDVRRRAAKTVEALHKYGCEAKLTEEA